MSLKDIILKIKDLALKFPDIHSVFHGDVYQLNEMPNVNYGACIISQGQHNVNVDENKIIYNFIIFIVDRQTSDMSNVLDIQSHSVDLLNGIAGALNGEDDLIIYDYSIECFSERFSSLCSGAFMRIGVEVPINDCENYKIN